MGKYYKTNKQGGVKMKEVIIVGPNYPIGDDFKITLELDDNINTEESIKAEIIKEMHGLNIKIDEQNIEKIGDNIYRIGLIVGEKGEKNNYQFKLTFHDKFDPKLEKELYEAIQTFLDIHSDKSLFAFLFNESEYDEDDYDYI
jgi:hypothetical protein